GWRRGLARLADRLPLGPPAAHPPLRPRRGGEQRAAAGGGGVWGGWRERDLRDSRDSRDDRDKIRRPCRPCCPWSPFFLKGDTIRLLLGGRSPWTTPKSPAPSRRLPTSSRSRTPFRSASAPTATPCARSRRSPCRCGGGSRRG